MLEINNEDKLEFDVPDNLKTTEIQEFINRIENKINSADIILVVDRFEEEYAVCENRETGEILKIERYKLPNDANEGSVLKYENGQYIIDKNIQEEIAKRIKEKMKNLWVD